MAGCAQTLVLYTTTLEFSPSFYRRYVDNTFCLMKEESHANSFLEFINSINSQIQFDIELENDGKLAFLDTVLSRPVNNSVKNCYPDISTKVKSTDRGLLYNYASFIPEKYKNNLIYCLIYRVYHIASSYHIFDIGLKHLENKFVSNGFPICLVDTIVGKFLNKQYCPESKPTTAPKKSCVLILPYLGFKSIYTNRKLKRLVQKFYPSVELKIIYKRGLSIRSFFSYKDRLPLKCSSNVVYYISYKSCGSRHAYIGKTINTVYERFYGANGHLNPLTKKSALLEHLTQDVSPTCEFDISTIKILDRCGDDLRLRFAENIHLKLGKQSLNTQERSIPLNII